MNKKRWLDILNLLVERVPVTSETLAKQLQLSSKTVRTEMKELQKALDKEGAHLYSRTNAGYYLEITDRKQYDRFLSSLQGNGDMPVDSQERIRYILEVLLENDGDYIKLDDLAEQLYISRSRLVADLNEVKAILKEYHLSMEAKPHYGFRLKAGDEMDVRLCMASQLVRRLDHRIEPDMLLKIARCISLGLKDSVLKINEAAHQNLFIHIYIALKRISKGCFVQMNPEHETRPGTSAVYQAAVKIGQLLQQEFGVVIPEHEVGYIAVHLSGKQILKDYETNGNLVISPEVSTLITQMLDTVYNSYQLDFHDNLELHMSLALHLIPLLTRLRYGMNLSNPLLEEIKTKYQFGYMLAVSACEVLARQFAGPVPEDEIGYIAMHFSLALERRRVIDKKNVVIVCSTGGGSARLLVWKFEEEFGRFINRIDTCELLQLKELDLTDYDYIISTVSIPFPVNRPILQIQMFFDDRDRSAVRKLLNKPTDFSVKRYFSPELFLSGLEAAGKEEVLRLMVDRISSVKRIPVDFYESVLKREAMAVTCFGNLVAVPHPHKAMTEETFVCVAVLKKPVLWDKRKVQFVFLLSLKTPVDDDMQYFTRITSKLLFSSEYVGEMIRRPEYGTLMDVLGLIEKETGG